MTSSTFMGMAILFAAAVSFSRRKKLNMDDQDTQDENLPVYCLILSILFIHVEKVILY
jgi:hypothetical protein